MSETYIGEVRAFGFTFAMRNWAYCDGQILPIQQNAALFSILGTSYGGNGTTTFGLPNLQGNAPMAPGQGPGLSLHDLGETGGSATVTLTPNQVPSHTHGLQGSPRDAEEGTPTAQSSLARSNPGFVYKQPSGANQPQPMAAGILGGAVGGNAPHNNMMPYLALNFCIALQGIYPSRS